MHWGSNTSRILKKLGGLRDNFTWRGGSWGGGGHFPTPNHLLYIRAWYGYAQFALLLVWISLEEESWERCMGHCRRRHIDIPLAVAVLAVEEVWRRQSGWYRFHTLWSPCIAPTPSGRNGGLWTSIRDSHTPWNLSLRLHKRHSNDTI